METMMNDPWAALEGPSTRTPRSLETRERSERRQAWRPSALLPEPKPQDGWRFKWVKTATRGVNDKVHVEKHTREGWTPALAEQHPEIMAEWNSTQTTGIIEFGGLMLCKLPEERALDREAYFAQMTADNERSADEHHMRDSSELAKKFKDHQRKVVFGQRSR